MSKRYFKLPIDTEYGTGWWYGEFDEEWISRQIEVYLDRDTALVGGRDVDLLDQSLGDSGIAYSGGHEISPEEFELIWRKYYRG